MAARKIATTIAVCFLVATSATTVRAQQAYYESDLQWFSPVDLDFNDRPIRKDSGYFFHFDKLSWAFTGERRPLGSAGTSDGSFGPFRNFDDGGILIPDPSQMNGDNTDLVLLPGTPISIPAPFLPSGISSGPPRAQFAWGERYELGVWNDNSGWLVGILDGPEAVSDESFGFGLTGQDNTVSGGTGDMGIGLPSPFPNAANQLISPLGSVLIVFDDPLNLMRGFIDVLDNTIGTVPGGALEADTNGDGVLDGDGLADDINNNGQFGPDGFISTTDGTAPDKLPLGSGPDFGDLVTLPTSFQTVSVRNSTELQGIEIMRMHRLSNRHLMAKHQNNDLEFQYGVRYLRLRDNFLVNGSGGVLGTSFWDTTITNNLVGPQIALKWKHQRRRILFDFGGRFLFGYNIQNFNQTAALGEDLIPGQHNHPLFFPPTVSKHGKQENDFSPVVELRAQASYQLSSAIALKLGYTATFVDNIRRAAQQVKYQLPNMGFRNGGTQEIFISGVNFGFEAVY